MTDYKRIHRIDFIEEECIMAKVIEEHVKDPGSAITHFIGMLMAIFAAIPAADQGGSGARTHLYHFHRRLRRQPDPFVCGKHNLPYL